MHRVGVEKMPPQDWVSPGRAPVVGEVQSQLSAMALLEMMLPGDQLES